MGISISLSPVFEKQSERLFKKYPSVFQDIGKLVERLKKDPEQGESLGKGLYKIRLAITSKGQGKSGGARVITCVRLVKDQVILLAIYDKSEQETLSAKELLALMKYT